MRKKVLLMAALAVVLVSCKKSEKSGDSVVDSGTEKAAIAQDSILKLEQAESELAKQDSIDAIQIKGYKVKLVEGKHKYNNEKTDVEYISLYKEIENRKADATKEMWTPEKLKNTINTYKQSAKGGVISIRIERLTINSADPSMLTVIVKDEKDKEIFREEMESSVANHSSSSDMWYNYTSAFIPTRVKTPFYIYVVDKLQDVPLKYEVTPIK